MTNTRRQAVKEDHLLAVMHHMLMNAEPRGKVQLEPVCGISRGRPGAPPCPQGLAPA
jgi:hypothetical protein